MSNTFVTSNLVIKYITMHLWNHLVAAKLVHRDLAASFVGSYETGGTVTIQKPLEFRVNDGAVIAAATDMYRRSFSMSATSRKNVPFALSIQERTYDMFKNRTQKEIIEPACQSLATQIETDVLAVAKQFPNQIGTPGTTPNSTRIPRQAAERLTYFGVDENNRHLVMDPAMVTEMNESTKGLFIQSIARESVSGIANKGKLSTDLAGFNCYESPNIYRLTTGTMADQAVTKAGASSDEDTTLALENCGNGLTLVPGDIFTVADTYAVNPATGSPYPFLRQFVAGAAGAQGVSGQSSAGGELSAQTAIPGTAPYNIRSASSAAAKLPYQNLYTLPGNGKAVTIAGAASTIYPLSLAFHRDAIALATVPLPEPETAVLKKRQDWNGISLLITAGYDVLTTVETYRIDVLYGAAMLEPFAGCRIIG